MQVNEFFRCVNAYLLFSTLSDLYTLGSEL
jgi:hypothetical protein